MEIKIKERESSRKVLLLTCLILGVFTIYNYSVYNSFKDTPDKTIETIEINRLEINPSMSITGNIVDSKLYPSGGNFQNEIYFTSITPTMDLNVKYDTNAVEPIDIKGSLNIVLALESEEQWIHEIELIKDKSVEIKNTSAETIINEKIEVNIADLQRWIDSVEDEIGVGQSRYNWTFKSNLRGEATYGGESKAFECLVEQVAEDTGDTIEIVDETSAQLEKIVFEKEKEKIVNVSYLGERTSSQAAKLSLVLTVVGLLAEVCSVFTYFKIKPDKKIKIDKHVKKILDKSIELNSGFKNHGDIIWISGAKAFVELTERRELEIFFIEVGSGKKYFALEEGIVYGYCIDELFDKDEITEEYSEAI